MAKGYFDAEGGIVGEAVDGDGSSASHELGGKATFSDGMNDPTAACIVSIGRQNSGKGKGVIWNEEEEKERKKTRGRICTL